VLAHGIVESRRAWDPLLEPLARDHQVVTLDLRGHGESERRPPYDVFTMANDLNRVMRAAGVANPVLVGHSLGGFVVTIAAATVPCAGVVTIDQPLLLGGAKALLSPFEPMLRGGTASFEQAMRDLAGVWRSRLADSERARLEGLAHPEQEVVLGAWEVVLDSNPEELDDLIKEGAYSITVPYLALHGDDPGAEYRDWLQTVNPHTVFEVWPDHGHYPHLLDQPRFLRLLAEFEETVYT
jgi:pimeloyl-ACP methyl ester carboxylesterase